MRVWLSYLVWLVMEIGSIDDFSGLADVVEKYGIYFYVDAVRRSCILLQDPQEQIAGIERADSVIHHRRQAFHCHGVKCLAVEESPDQGTSSTCTLT